MILNCAKAINSVISILQFFTDCDNIDLTRQANYCTIGSTHNQQSDALPDKSQMHLPSNAATEYLSLHVQSQNTLAHAHSHPSSAYGYTNSQAHPTTTMTLASDGCCSTVDPSQCDQLARLQLACRLQQLNAQPLSTLDYATFVQHTQPITNTSTSHCQSNESQLLHTLLPNDLDVHLLQLHSTQHSSLDCLNSTSAQMTLNCSPVDALIDQSTLNQYIQSNPPTNQLSASQSTAGKQINIYHDGQIDPNTVSIF